MKFNALLQSEKGFLPATFEWREDLHVFEAVSMGGQPHGGHWSFGDLARFFFGAEGKLVSMEFIEDAAAAELREDAEAWRRAVASAPKLLLVRLADLRRELEKIKALANRALHGDRTKGILVAGLEAARDAAHAAMEADDAC